MDKKINISNFFLIIAIVIIFIMGFFIYLLYNNNQKANMEIARLNEQLSAYESTINSLQSNINGLQDNVTNLKGTIDNVSKIINSTESDDNSTSKDTTKNNYNLKLGNYTVNEIKEDEGGVTNEECGVKLTENNEFKIYMGWGVSHSGKYEIKDNNLICKSTLLEWEGGAGDGNRKTDVVFTFKIINDNKLELSSIDINDKNTKNLIYNDGLTIGMTYSIN